MTEHIGHFLHEAWIAILFAFIFAELLEINARVAKWIVRRAAVIRYTDPERASVRGEEWASVIDSRPGQTLKLLTAMRFLTSAAWTACPRWIRAARQRSGSKFSRFAPAFPRLLTGTFIGATVGLSIVNAVLAFGLSDFNRPVLLSGAFVGLTIAVFSGISMRRQILREREAEARSRATAIALIRYAMAYAPPMQSPRTPAAQQHLKGPHARHPGVPAPDADDNE